MGAPKISYDHIKRVKLSNHLILLEPPFCSKEVNTKVNTTFNKYINNNIIQSIAVKWDSQ